MNNFWDNLKKPFLVLAPMENVTDYVFREIVCDLARPDVMFTEFTSADGLISPGKERVIPKLKYSERQRPIVAQIWGGHPESMYEAAKLVKDMGFDGVDINLGCPDRNVMKKPGGSGLIGNYEIVGKIIDAVKRGAEGIPLSIKTRLRYKEVTTKEWMSFLLEQNIEALTVHGRTPEQQSKGEADWEEVGEIVKLKNIISPKTIIIGNGDIKSYGQAYEKYEKHKIDGVMIGRGIFSDPWIFDKSSRDVVRPREDYLKILLKHLNLFEEIWGKKKNFAILKKFFKMYVKNFIGATALRERLMEAKKSDEIRSIVGEYI